MIEALFEFANIDMMIVAMPDSVVKNVSASLLTKWHCAKSDVIGKPLLKFGSSMLSARQLPPDQSQPDLDIIEVNYAPPLGSQIKMLFRTKTYAAADGASEMLLISQHGDTALAETNITNERRLNLLLRSSGYALWDHDYETNVTYNAPEMIEVFGEVVDGAALGYKNFNALIHPEDAGKTIDEKIRNAPFGTDSFQTRYRVKTRSGKYAWIECLAGLTRDPTTGFPKKIIGLCRNVDHEMLNFDRLKNSELMLKRTQALSHIGSFKLRVESGVSRLTAELAALIGLADAMVHPNLDTFIKMIEPGAREKFVECLKQVKTGKQVKTLEISVRTKSDDIEWFAVTMEPEYNSTGEVENIFGACQLVTERKTLENRFQQVQKMEAVGQLTGGIAHDFNNLLMVVMGNLQLVEQLVKGNEHALRRIRAAINAADKGSDLTRRMLAFSRQQTLQNKQLAVNDLLASMQITIAQAVTQEVEVNFTPGANLWPVKVDKTMLETSILNLAINARDAMAPKGGKLIIESHNRTLDRIYAEAHDDVEPGDYVEISVTDAGVGIAPENMEKVFQPFFTTKGPEAGSGLGLSMVYGFIKQSGGHINIYSEVGSGTSVKLYLPRMKQAENFHVTQKPVENLQPLPTPENLPVLKEPTVSPAPNVVEAPPVVAPPEIRRTKVLVVEDNSSVREVAAAMIEEMGFDAITATNGRDGLIAINEQSDIDLVLSDIIMAGGMNGPEMAAKAILAKPDLKVLFMSGYAPVSVRQIQGLPDSMDLVSKPFTRSDLTEKIKKALAAA